MSVCTYLFVLSLSNKTPASKTFQSVSQSGTLVLGYTQRPIAASKTCCCSSNAHYCSCKQKLLGFVASWLLSSFDETSLLLLRRQLTGWAFSLQCCSAASFFFVSFDTNGPTVCRNSNYGTLPSEAPLSQLAPNFFVFLSPTLPLR